MIDLVANRCHYQYDLKEWSNCKNIQDTLSSNIQKRKKQK